ncbi:DUF1134 domain-containing protein [Novosphingobium bradum]|uniref:DUF1134 domain-containing protein n=1 Tax=Novosphingobium bradum TaxID=1737444 RepID=A0ABV7IP58_9SPHN
MNKPRPTRVGRLIAVFTGAALALTLAAQPAIAQVRAVDPDAAIDGDLVRNGPAPSINAAPVGATPVAEPEARAPVAPAPASVATPAPVVTSANPERAAAQAATNPVQAGAQGATYHEDDLIGAAEGVFGKGAHGLADIIKDLLKKQGEPNGYIVGREGGGAVVVGLRYGSGTLYHKVEGKLPVYWTGPSVGLDLGASAGNTFVLVYNLYNSEDLYHRYGAGEGQAYLVGGFHVSYLRRGDVVLIPVRMGVGLRLGLNAGYMNFTRKSRWLPF